jgi:hypothetical protein
MLRAQSSHFALARLKEFAVLGKGLTDNGDRRAGINQGLHRDRLGTFESVGTPSLKHIA